MAFPTFVSIGVEARPLSDSSLIARKIGVLPLIGIVSFDYFVRHACRSDPPISANIWPSTMTSSIQPSTENQKLAAALAALDPPRKHYQQYLSSRRANDDLWHPPQGLHAFLRAFFYVKSGDWPETSRIR